MRHPRPHVGGAPIVSLAPLAIRHPHPYDIVGDPVVVCGFASASEGRLVARLRDGHGVELARAAIDVPPTVTASFLLQLHLTRVPETSLGSLAVLRISSDDRSEALIQLVPLLFGRALVDPYLGFRLYRVQPGDTLEGIASQVYGDAALAGRIFEANQHQMNRSRVIFPEQVLRIPF